MITPRKTKFCPHKKMRNAYKILITKSKWKRLLGRTRYRWKDNIKVDLRQWALGVWIKFIWFVTETGVCKEFSHHTNSIREIVKNDRLFPTLFMDQSPSWEADCRSACQEMRLLRNLMVQYSTHKNLPLCSYPKPDTSNQNLPKVSQSSKHLRQVPSLHNATDNVPTTNVVQLGYSI